MSERLTALFSGDVQGVGFRMTAGYAARGFPDVTGYVRNRPDGRVEIVAEGERERLRDFLKRVQEHMSGYIRSTDTSWSEATGEFAGFRIRH